MRLPPSSDSPQLLLPKSPVKFGRQAPHGNQETQWAGRTVLRAPSDHIFPLSTRKTEAQSRRQCLAYCYCGTLLPHLTHAFSLAIFQTLCTTWMWRTSLGPWRNSGQILALSLPTSRQLRATTWKMVWYLATHLLPQPQVPAKQKAQAWQAEAWDTKTASNWGVWKGRISAWLAGHTPLCGPIRQPPSGI